MYIFKRSWIVILICLFGVLANAQEEQVAFMPGVYELTQEHRKESGLLNELSAEFHKAQLYQNLDDYFLRIEYREHGTQWIEDIPISFSELTIIRESLQSSLVNSSMDSTDGRIFNSRSELVTSVSLNAIVQSRLISNLFKKEVAGSVLLGTTASSERTKFGRAFPYLATYGAISGSLYFTSGKDILPSAANLHLWGSILGYGHGLLLSTLIRQPYSVRSRNELESMMMAGTSLFEGWMGYHIAKKHKFTYIQSKAIISGNIWGTLTGMMTNGMFARYDMFGDVMIGTSIGYSGIMGATVGMLAANRLIQRYPRTSGDLSVINMGGFLGAVWGYSIAIGLESEGRGGFSSMFLGTLGGLALSGRITAHTAFTTLEGGFINVSSIAGGALGVGFAYLLDVDDDGYSYAATIGFTAGYIICFKVFSNNKRQRKSRGLGEHFKWNINPSGIGMMMSSPEQQANLMLQNIRMDIVSVSFTF